jgi:DNA invertase Pin-like site-specific DNA recombinase
MGKMFFNILATFAEFEVDLLRLRTREGMAIARAKGRLRGKPAWRPNRGSTDRHRTGAPATERRHRHRRRDAPVGRTTC